ncbi:pentapeptide repeat-containing protein [Bacillus sp. T3]|uniref:pentapeptide repeat-containing protein n=1 Tax=Bacillus sp. T3 TaxID=467262 RepID=UPI0029812B9F|nr:pentapeptide repeat-containing protein [Bacillus sp. T3]
MSKILITKQINHFQADCSNCFGLCCVALPYANSADFAYDKASGTPCHHLQSDYSCSIHRHLRNKGFKGCTVYECFGAGQKVSQFSYNGNDWREHPELAQEMFDVFPIMQQLYEMLRYLYEALYIEETEPIKNELNESIFNIESLTNLSPKEILALDVPMHRVRVNELLLYTSKVVRGNAPRPKKQRKLGRGVDLIGAKLRGADLRGANLRGALLIAADLKGADLRYCDLIGADLRDANLSGANLTGSIFLTQVQVNSAKGDKQTKLPPSLRRPEHWE